MMDKKYKLDYEAEWAENVRLGDIVKVGGDNERRGIITIANDLPVVIFPHRVALLAEVERDLGIDAVYRMNDGLIGSDFMYLLEDDFEFDCDLKSILWERKPKVKMTKKEIADKLGIDVKDFEIIEDEEND